MDNGLNDMAQVLNITENYFELSIKLTKEGLNLIKNLGMLMLHSFKYAHDKKLENVKGKVGKNTLKKLTKNIAWTRTSNDDLLNKKFLKLCKQHGIPVTLCEGLKDSKENHWMYPAEYSSMMESVMKFMQEEATKKFQKDGLSKEDAEEKANAENRTENPEEAAIDLGCDMPHEKFKQRFLETMANPEEKAYYDELNKKKPLINDKKKTEIKNAIQKNEDHNKSKRFEASGMYSVAFKKDQIIGTVEKNNEKYVKIRFENDYSQAFLVNQKNIARNGNQFYGAFDKDGDITIYDLKNNSEKTIKFNEFMSESKSNSEKRSTDKTKTHTHTPKTTSESSITNKKGKIK